MSSYQFVNSLASCYANQQQQARSGTSPVDQTGHQQHQAASPGADYYNPNAAAASAYPPSCYSPPQVTGHHYPQHPYATPATATSGAHNMQPSGMVDYTQLQPQRLSGSGPSHLHHPSPGGAQSPGLLAPQQQNPSASCKYADSTSSTSVASPQDLSTTGGGPTRSSPPLNSTQTSSGTSSNATVTSKTSPLSVSTSPQGKQANASSTVSQNLSSPASSTSSTSSSERTANSNNNSKSGNSSNPPQIYPWMKRVHLGQSKCSLIFCINYIFYSRQDVETSKFC